MQLDPHKMVAKSSVPPHSTSPARSSPLSRPPFPFNPSYLGNLGPSPPRSSSSSPIDPQTTLGLFPTINSYPLQSGSHALTIPQPREITQECVITPSRSSDLHRRNTRSFPSPTSSTILDGAIRQSPSFVSDKSGPGGQPQLTPPASSSRTYLPHSVTSSPPYLGRCPGAHPITPSPSQRHFPIHSHSHPRRRISSSHSLAGSYTLSLISSRMSHAHPSHSIESAFTLQIGCSSSSSTTPTRLKSPAHIKIPFEARWHDLEGGPDGAAVSTPWVGCVDVEKWYFDRFEPHSEDSIPSVGEVEWEEDAQRQPQDTGRTRSSMSYSPGVGMGSRKQRQTTSPDAPKTTSPPPPFPGYEVGSKGLLQLIIKNQFNALKVFLIPYDLSSLVPGGRLLVRERGYQAVVRNAAGVSPDLSTRMSPTTTMTKNNSHKNRREVLRFAVELQFICVAVHRKKTKRSSIIESGLRAMEQKEKEGHGNGNGDSVDSDGRGLSGQDAASKCKRKDAGVPKAYFLSKQIRVVFPSILDSNGSDQVKDETKAAISAATATAGETRKERFVEVMNPPDVNADAMMTLEQLKILRKTSFSSAAAGDHWDQVRSKWKREEREHEHEHEKEMNREEEARKANASARAKANTPSTLGLELSFARITTPPPIYTRSSSLLTAKLASPQLESSAAPPLEAMTTASNGPSTGRRLKMGDQDSERILSESLQGLKMTKEGFKARQGQGQSTQYQ